MVTLVMDETNYVGRITIEILLVILRYNYAYTCPSTRSPQTLTTCKFERYNDIKLLILAHILNEII